MNDIGKTDCRSCGQVIYAWLDDCPHCGFHQQKEQLSIAERLKRAGIGVPDDMLQLPVEENCNDWEYDGSLEALKNAGVKTLGDLLNRSEAELKELFPNKKQFRRIMRRLPCPDTRPITDEERESKARLLGAIRGQKSASEQRCQVQANVPKPKLPVKHKWPDRVDPRGPESPIFEVVFEINLANCLYYAGTDTLAEVAALKAVDLLEAFHSDEQVKEVIDCLTYYRLPTEGAQEALRLWLDKYK